MTLTPAQSRAARGLLEWSQEELATRSNLSESTVREFEKGRRVPTINNVAAIRHAMETAGVEFTNDDAPGVKLRTAPRGDPAASIKVEDLTAENDE